MSEPIVLHFDVDGKNFSKAGEASATVKKTLQELGYEDALIRRVSICLYEGEINMVIHANGGTIDVTISDECIKMELNDQGEGIGDIQKAMQEGYSTADDYIREMGFGAGMGLPNMRRYSDDLEIFSTSGQGVRVVMRIQI